MIFKNKPSEDYNKIWCSDYDDNDEKRWYNVIHDVKNIYSNIITTDTIDKYESLPNFIGGLFIEDNKVKIRTAKNETIELGSVTDVGLNGKIFSTIMDKILE